MEVTTVASGIATLDQFLHDGFARKGIAEFGIPHTGRQVLLPFIANATNQACPTLWVNGFQELEVYPPLMFSKRIDAQKIFFVNTSEPFQRLKPVFANPVFKLLILDSVKLSLDECLYLRQHADRFGCLILLIRNYYLSNQQGNITAQVRVNVEFDVQNQHFRLHKIKGIPPHELKLAAQELV